MARMKHSPSIQLLFFKPFNVKRLLSGTARKKKFFKI